MAENLTTITNKNKYEIKRKNEIKGIPTHINFENGRVVIDDANNATHMLVMMEATINSTICERIVRVGSQCYVGLRIRYDDLDAIYVRTDVQLGLDDKIVRAAASAFATGTYNYDMARPTNGDIIHVLFGIDRRVYNVDDAECLEQIVNNRWEKLASAAYYLQHVKPSTIYESATDERKQMMIHMVRKIHQYNVAISTAATLLMYIAIAPKYAAVTILESDAWHAENINEWARTTKNITIKLKGLQNVIDAQLLPLFEAEVMLNRGIGEIDWQQEVRNRTHPDVVHVDQNKLYKILVDEFRMGLKMHRKPNKVTFDQLWKARWDWATTGSYHSQYKSDMRFADYEDRHFRNKFVGLIKMNNYGLDYWLAREPEIAAWPSDKYEWGKKRAIYGTDLTSFIIATLAFSGAEKAMSDRFPIGKRADENYVSRLTKTMLEGTSPYCFDYEDFNSQHSFESMQTVVDAYSTVFDEYITEDQRRALSWTRASISNQVIYNNDAAKQIPARIRTNGTLFSGWRLTSLMNSILNYGYMAAAGITDLTDVKTTIHNGDDVLMAITKPQTVQKILHMAAAANMRAQTHKCNAFAVAEFLRVDRWSGSGGGQYLTRGVATYVHSRYESNEPNDCRAELESILTRAAEIMKRGAEHETTLIITEKLIDKLAERRSVPSDKLRAMASAHRVAGGLSTHPGAPIDTQYNMTEATKEDVETEDILGHMPGVDDMVQRISEMIETDIYEGKVRRAIKSATVRALTYVRRQLITSKNEQTEKMQTKRALYKSLANEADDTTIGRLKLAGLNVALFGSLIKSTTLRAAIRASSDPNEMLQYRL